MSQARMRTLSGLQLLLLLFCLLATDQAAVAASLAAPCPASDADCVVQNLAAGVRGQDVLSGLSLATRRLTIRNVALIDWPATDAELAKTRAGQLESLELDRVSLGSNSSSSSSSSLQQQQQLRGASMPSLRTLRIRGGAACPFAGGVVGFAGLQELSVRDCRLGAALTPTWLRELPQLKRLAVENAKVDSLHLAGLDAPTLAALEDIRLGGNSLNTLADDAFGSMPNLQNLTLDGNVIQYIQAAAFTRLPNLLQLSISLPKEGQLAKIWEASLDGRFDSNTKLQTLRLVNARLAEEQIPKTFDQLKQLRVLDLSGHRFRRLHNSVLSSLTSLEQLNLSNGSLVCLYDRNFGVMSRLKQLNLANNEIRMIGKRALLGLSALQSLDLSGNPLEVIEAGAFCTLGAIKDSPQLLSSWGLDASRVEGAANVSQACPADFNPNQLILSSRPQCATPKGFNTPKGADQGNSSDSTRRSPEQSRHTFLIIIGLCVAFLLITVISMMAYKGWSKRKNAQMAKDEEKELELQAMVAAAEEGGASPSGANSEHHHQQQQQGKKPQNGRQHKHHHHQGGGSGKPTTDGKKLSPSTGTVPSAAPATAPAAASENTVETTAQVESPERCNSQTAGDTAQEEHTTVTKPTTPATASGQQQPPPQMRPGITPMTTVPEDSDLEARAITTLVVI